MAKLQWIAGGYFLLSSTLSLHMRLEKRGADRDKRKRSFELDAVNRSLVQKRTSLELQA